MLEDFTDGENEAEFAWWLSCDIKYRHMTLLGESIRRSHLQV
jgi:hypothetical protein